MPGAECRFTFDGMQVFLSVSLGGFWGFLFGVLPDPLSFILGNWLSPFSLVVPHELGEAVFFCRFGFCRFIFVCLFVFGELNPTVVLVVIVFLFVDCFFPLVIFAVR
jgi:hypothetical protein